jgi:hypothetical protein
MTTEPSTAVEYYRIGQSRLPKKYKSWPMIHRILTLSKETCPTYLKFKALKPKNDPGPASGLEAYLKEITDEGYIYPNRPMLYKLGLAANYSRKKFKRASPWDIPIKEQCIIILHLDTNINWRFSSESPALTTKNRRLTNYRFLRHVDKTGALPKNHKPLGQGKRCIIIVFALVNREDEPKNDHVNFHIEVPENIRDEKSRMMEIIFDPDIPNTNGQIGKP